MTATGTLAIPFTVAAARQLAATGSNEGPISLLAFVLLTLGGLLCFAGRRRAMLSRHRR
jgi:LPXTG-motif cell wall-anchored protein